MANHHFIPQFILRKFRSKDAWKLIDDETAQNNVMQKDLKSIGSSNPPICVLNKDKQKLERKVVRKSFSVQNLYWLPQDANSLEGDILRMYLSIENPFRDYTQRNNPDYINPETVEKIELGAIDSNFSGIARKIDKMQALTSEEIDFSIKFVLFSRLRNPIYKNNYFDSKLPNPNFNFRKIEKIFKNYRYKKHFIAGTPEEKAHHAISILEKYMFALEINKFWSVCEKYSNKFFLKIYCSEKKSFVMSDNPSRPFRPDRPEMFIKAQPNLWSDPNIEIFQVVSPTKLLSLTPTLEGRRGCDYVRCNNKTVFKYNVLQAKMYQSELLCPSPIIQTFFPTNFHLNNLASLKYP